ncbi:MAG: transcriptional regulator [Nocardioides sp.]|nr:transcriptional regulator [Nocardioides sp.]
MLSLLTGTAMSAAEVARELDLTHANASYHLRTLLDAGELVLDGEETIRGGVAKRYRYPHERRGVSPEGAHASADDQLFYVRAVGQEVERRMALRERGTQNVSSDLEGWVDPGTWDEAVALLAQASALLHDANQAPRTPGTVHVAMTAFAFRMQEQA